MPRVSRSEYADLSGVSKAAITKAVKAGRLLVDSEDKIDTDNPLSLRYLDEQRARAAREAVILPSTTTPKAAPQVPKTRRAPHIDRGPPAGSSERKPRGDTVSPPFGDSQRAGLSAEEIQKLKDLGLGALTLKDEKDKADIALKRAQTRKHDLFLAERKKELILRDLVRRDYAAFDAALKANLMDFPRRASASLYALAMSGGQKALEEGLERECSLVVERCHSAADDLGLI